MSTADLAALKREHPGWTIAFYTTSAGEHYTATLPGVVVKADTAARLRKRLADGGYTARAVAAMADAAQAEPDFAAWLAGVLAEVAADAEQARLWASAAQAAANAPPLTADARHRLAQLLGLPSPPAAERTPGD